MDFWSILEIEPTDNVSIVKKAYAKKLKLHHPEDDPEGYQKLREAYDRAIKYIKNNNSKAVEANIDKSNFEVQEYVTKEEVIEENNVEDMEQTLPHLNFTEDINEQTPSFEEAVEEFINKVQVLYNNFFSRINIENWIELLNSEAMWYIGGKKLLSDKMIEFLMEKHYLPQDVWKLLEDNFNWIEPKEYLYGKYPESFINYLYKKITDNNGLRYCYFKEISDVDYEAFLDYREKAFEALSREDFEYAEECIANAHNIYADDPDLFIMMGRCYVLRGDTDKALQIYEKVIQENDEDICARFYRAKILYDLGQIDRALEDCKYIEALSFDNSEFNLLAAKCYLKAEKFSKAKQLLLKLKEKKQFQADVKTLLRQVNLKLVNELRNELKSDRQNDIIRTEVDNLYKELGMLNDKQLKRKILWIFIRRFIICLLVLVIQVITIHSTMKNMGIKDYHSLKNTLQFVMFWDKAHLVKNSEDINKLPGEISTVGGELTDAGFLDLYRIPQKNKQGKNINLYLSSKEAKKRKLFGYMNGYVCVGTLGDKKVIAIVNYKQAMQAYKNKTIDFNGAIHYMHKDDLLSEIEKLYRTNDLSKGFITDKFIDTEEKMSNSRSFTLCNDAWLMFIQVAVILQGVAAAYKRVKVNRK